MMTKIKGTLTVITVCFMIAFFAYTPQIFVIWPYLKTMINTTQMICLLVPLNLCIGMTFIHYFLTCFTNPGSVPIRYTQRQQAYVEVKKSTHAPRFCKTCDNYKPPRTHHCSTCQRCVLKMDHHCPWVNNCVGYFNYCHFIRFIINVNISCIYILILLCLRLHQIIKNVHQYHPVSLEIGFLSINLIGIVVVMVTVGILTGYHAYCIVTNTSTIEGWEKGRSMTIKGMGRIQNVKKPYDQGIYKNLCTVLGPPLFWLLPLPMKGTGLDFPISLRHVDHEDMIEPSFSSTTQLTRPLSAETFCSIHDGAPLKKLPSQNMERPTSFSTFVSNTTTLV